MLELRGRERKGFQIEIEFLPRITTGLAVPELLSTQRLPGITQDYPAITQPRGSQGTGRGVETSRDRSWLKISRERSEFWRWRP